MKEDVPLDFANLKEIAPLSANCIPVHFSLCTSQNHHRCVRPPLARSLGTFCFKPMGNQRSPKPSVFQGAGCKAGATATAGRVGKSHFVLSSPDV